MEIKITVIKGENFLDSGNRPLDNWNPKGNRSFILLMYLSKNCTSIGL